MRCADMRISVIIVVKNGQKFLRAAIGSILRQTQQPYEIIVVDGHSTDRTASIARSYPNVTFVPQRGHGLATARNMGIDRASGELIAFLDHDDLWDPEKLAIQSAEISNGREIQYCYAYLRFISANFVADTVAPLGGYPGYRPGSHIGRTPGTLVVRKSLFREVGRFNSDYAIGCDAEWFLRAQDLGIPCSCIPKVLLFKRLHSTNLSRNISVNRREIFMIVKQSLDRRRRPNG